MARNYDARRAKSSRWLREIETMESMLAEVKPVYLADCPFGTGRWIPQYEAQAVQSVVGIDLSRGMLDQAEAKLKSMPAARRACYKLIEESIFNVRSRLITDRLDAIICVRFLNWVSFQDAERSLVALGSLGAKNAILGVSVIPEGTGLLRRLLYRFAAKWANRKDGPAQYVHDERQFLAMLSRLGWRLERKSLVMNRPSRANFFYLLRTV
jgi:SAM-dependent methyltransferase